MWRHDSGSIVAEEQQAVEPWWLQAAQCHRKMKTVMEDHHVAQTLQTQDTFISTTVLNDDSYVAKVASKLVSMSAN